MDMSRPVKVLPAQIDSYQLILALIGCQVGMQQPKGVCGPGWCNEEPVVDKVIVLSLVFHVLAFAHERQVGSCAAKVGEKAAGEGVSVAAALCFESLVRRFSEREVSYASRIHHAAMRKEP